MSIISRLVVGAIATLAITGSGIAFDLAVNQETPPAMQLQVVLEPQPQRDKMPVVYEPVELPLSYEVPEGGPTPPIKLTVVNPGECWSPQPLSQTEYVTLELGM